MITAVLIDQREPKWIQSLKFGDIPTSVTILDTGDLQAVTDDGCMLLIERKTPEDLLNSLRDERLMPQIARLVQDRLDQQAMSSIVSTWPYLVITGELRRGPGGKVITDERNQTGWSYNAVQGALLTIQEMGCMVITCASDEYEKCVLQLGNRKRDELKIIPPRIPTILGPGSVVLLSLPGVGPERLNELLNWSGGIVGHAISGITDLDIDCPLPATTRRKIRAALGLRNHQQIAISFNASGDETLDILERIPS